MKATMAYRSTNLTRSTAAAKRAAFLRAARSLVATHGFSAASVTAIAQQSGTSVGLVYSYFDNRENLLSEVFRSVAEYELGVVKRAVDAAGDDPAAQIVALIDTFADRALQGRQMAWSLLFEPVTAGIGNERLMFRRSYHALGERIIRDGVAAEVFVAKNVNVSASAVMGAISEALVGSLSPLKQQNSASDIPVEVITEIRHFCLQALSATMSAPSR